MRLTGKTFGSWVGTQLGEARGSAIGQSNVEMSTPWVSEIIANCKLSRCETIGITAGTRQSTDRAAFDTLCQRLAVALASQDSKSRMLAIRLSEQLPPYAQKQKPDRIPVAQRSALGNWSELTLEASAAKPGSTLETLSKWLPSWKEAFQLIAIDLGSIGHPASRLVGRLCDSTYLLLGPHRVASQDWIMEQVAWHDSVGSTICASILAKAA